MSDERVYLEGEDERLVVEAFEKGGLKRAPDAASWAVSASRVAENTRRRDARTNIRLMRGDLSMLRIQAAREGLPYQTLISSVLHKYAAGTLREVEGAPLQ